MLAAWLLVISGITTLLIAANRKQKEHLCKQVLIGIRGTGEKFYIEKEDVVQMVEATANGSLLQKPVTSIDLAKLEKALETNLWIKTAELYFDSKDALHVFIEEREPIARIFTVEGNSFYIDSSGHKMPLLDKLSARVPVVTGFIDARKLSAKDSVLLREMKQVAFFIYSNKFWNAQIGQIDINADRKFELIPVIGDHVIKLGNGEKVEEKLNRLYVFYKQVMSKTGFNKYAALNIEYDGQVVAVQKGTTSVVDSIQLQMNIEALMNKSGMQNMEEENLPEQKINAVVKTDSTVRNTPIQNNPVPVKTNPNPSELNQTKSIPIAIGTAKTTNQSKPLQKPKQQVKMKPKAVMKKTDDRL